VAIFATQLADDTQGCPNLREPAATTSSLSVTRATASTSTVRAVVVAAMAYLCGHVGGARVGSHHHEVPSAAQN